MTPNTAIWISWERHRRSRELARALSVPLHEIVSDKHPYLRSISCSIRTIGLLFRIRPSLVFIQNPSVQLAYIACRLKPLLGYTLVVDRHSNFHFTDTEHGLFNYLSNYSLRNADLTIVTNEVVGSLVETKGGRAFILQDRLPELLTGPAAHLDGPTRVVYVCSFHPDEPVEEVLGAARLLGDEFSLYITGRLIGRFECAARRALPNVTFTGFLAEEAYVALLSSADVVVALTMRENTLLCSAYEGVSLLKPLVLSNQVVLRDYFKKGVVLTENASESIAKSIRIATRERDRLEAELAELVPELRADWESRFERLKERLGLGVNSNPR